jgi:hypothetical protein
MSSHIITLHQEDYPLVPDTVLLREDEYWEPAVGVDADEVLEDFGPELWAYIRGVFERQRNKREINPEQVTIYDAARDPRLGLSQNEFGQFLVQFILSGQGGMAGLNFYPGAVSAMKKLKAAGIQPIVVTATPGALDVSPDNEQPYYFGTAQELRRNRFQSAGIVGPHDIEWTGLFQKGSYLAKNRIPLLIDDHPGVAVIIARHFGLAAFMIQNENTRYNHGVYAPGVTAFPSLEAAYPAIIDFFETLRLQNKLRRSAA